MISNFLSNKTNLGLMQLLFWTLIVYVIMNGVETTGVKMFLIFLIVINNMLQHIWGVAQGMLHGMLSQEQMLRLFEEGQSSAKMKKFMEKYREFYDKDTKSE